MDDDDIRLYLHDSLTAAFPDLIAYHRPPGDAILSRPCIIYEPKSSEPSYANNVAYVVGTEFEVKFLSDIPGYAIERRMFSLTGIVVNHNLSYVTSDIVHDVFNISVNSIS